MSIVNRLEFDSIQVSFADRILLRSIYMACERGKVTGLVGRNGCGKSTLMKIVFGAITSAEKSVRLNGESLGKSYLSKKLIAYLPQSDLIPAHLTIHKALTLFGICESKVTRTFPETEAMMGLRPGALSGGYRRIFEIILILNSKAEFCLLDEPFTGLTPLFIERVKDLIRSARAAKGIVISDHMYKHVIEIADDLYLLSEGHTYNIHDEEQLISKGYLKSR